MAREKKKIMVVEDNLCLNWDKMETTSVSIATKKNNVRNYEIV